jgi:hypothetical protein
MHKLVAAAAATRSNGIAGDHQVNGWFEATVWLECC